jgi:deoxyribose-phosphate aldolase
MINKPIEQFIDHTLLKADSTETHIKILCEEAIKHNFYAVCINSCYLPLAKKLLLDSHVKLATVVGFPLGAVSTKAKLEEAKYAMEEGADEVDMVINLGWFKSAKYSEVQNEIMALKNCLDNKVLKVIIETCYLSPDEIKYASTLVLKGKADFVKTSTGFGSRGASFNDIALIKEAVGDVIKIKASGGIKDRPTAEEFIQMGVSRLGTSSGITILNKNNTL